MKNPLLMISALVVILGAVMRISHYTGASIVFYGGMSVFFFGLFYKKQQEKKGDAKEN
jgi:hypothetical protein